MKKYLVLTSYHGESYEPKAIFDTERAAEGYVHTNQGWGESFDIREVTYIDNYKDATEYDPRIVPRWYIRQEEQDD